jgi:hypothetical protein
VSRAKKQIIFEFFRGDHYLEASEISCSAGKFPYNPIEFLLKLSRVSIKTQLDFN